MGGTQLLQLTRCRALRQPEDASRLWLRLRRAPRTTTAGGKALGRSSFRKLLNVDRGALGSGFGVFLDQGFDVRPLVLFHRRCSASCSRDRGRHHVHGVLIHLFLRGVVTDEGDRNA